MDEIFILILIVSGEHVGTTRIEYWDLLKKKKKKSKDNFVQYVNKLIKGWIMTKIMGWKQKDSLWKQQMKQPEMTNENII